MTRRRLPCCAISALAALLVCFGATLLSADPADPPGDSSTAAPEPETSAPPPSSPSSEISPDPQELDTSGENSPTPTPPKVKPSQPAKDPKPKAKAPSAEQERRKQVLDDQFEELSEDAPPAGGAPDPEAPDSDAQRKPEVPTQSSNDEKARKSKAAKTADDAFEELTEDAPRAKSDEVAQPETPDEPVVEPVDKAEDEAPKDKAAAPDEAPAQAEDPEPEAGRKRRFAFRWDRGLRVEGSRFRLKVGGRLFVDAASISGDNAIESRFETGGFIGVPQARIDVTGTWKTSIYYRLQVDLTGESSSGRSRSEYIKSLFVGYVGPRWLGRAEIGLVKEPFSMGTLTSGLNTDFIERALPNVFAPSFNPGIVFRNEAFDDRLFWNFGVFRFIGSEGAKNRIDLAARVGGVPWKSEDGRDFVHLGASYVALFGEEFGLELGSRPETFFGDRWIETTGLRAKNGHLFGVELAGARRGFSYQSEIILSLANRSGQEDLLYWGGYAQVSYFITGEQRRYLKRQGVFGRVAINRAFSWKEKSWGAVEWTARYSYLDLNDADTRGGIMSDFTLGLNWYIFPNVRAMVNYVHAHVNGLGRGHIFQTRFQIDF